MTNIGIDKNSSHYDEGGINVMDVIKAKLTPEQFEGFLLGNVIKYALRANFKGQKERDIEKIGVYQGLLDIGSQCEHHWIDWEQPAVSHSGRICEKCGKIEQFK